jgi:hypothetical protein
MWYAGLAAPRLLRGTLPKYRRRRVRAADLTCPGVAQLQKRIHPRFD